MDGVMPYMRFFMSPDLRKRQGFVFKIDVEKAYQKVNWDFLLHCLNLSGFNFTWCGWMKQMTMGGTLIFKIMMTRGSILVHLKGFGKVTHLPFVV
jgi:hypothetical protein